MTGGFNVNKVDSVGVNVPKSTGTVQTSNSSQNNSIFTQLQNDTQKRDDLFGAGGALATKLATLEPGSPEYKAARAELNRIDNDLSNFNNRIIQEQEQYNYDKYLSEDKDQVEKAEQNSANKSNAPKFDVVN